MPSLDQAKVALAAVRSVTTDVPVAVSLTFNEEGNTIYGDQVEDAVRELEALGVPMIGANCSQGPQAMLDTVQRMAAVARSARLSAMPNAGAPALVEGRYVYLCTPEYMAIWARRFLEAGVTVVGGCCGTTPAHIRDLVGAVRMIRPAKAEVRVLPPARPREAPAPVPREEKSPLARKLGRSFVVSVELDPPRGADPALVIERAQYCKENEVDAINVADGPRASARMSAQALCVLLQSKVGIDTILHYTCRDRNLLGIQSDLLGAHALGLRNILAITGDPPKLGDYPDATAVYDVDSIGLIRILDHLNHGCDLAGNLIGPALGVHVGCGADPSRADVEKEVRQARGEGEGRGRVRDDAARLRSTHARALLLADQGPAGADPGRHPAALLAQERRVPPQRGARHDDPRRHPGADAQGRLRGAGAARGCCRSRRRRRSPRASWARAST